VLATASAGCGLLLPHHPCAAFTGEFRNIHGYAEIGHEDDRRREANASYDVNFIRPQVVARGERTIDLMIKDAPYQSISSVCGVTLFLRCPTPTREIAAHSTADGTLIAFLIRDDEYLGDHPRLNAYGKRLPPESADATGPLPPGVYPLAGSIEVRSDERFGVGFLKLNLDTRDSMPPDPAWLARRAAASASPSELAHLQSLGTRPASTPPMPAHLRGRFEVGRCLTLL
jgi:hypothetical protein